MNFSSRRLMTAGMAAITLGALVVSAGSALADDAPTTGTVSGGSGGNAVVTNIADLKLPLSAADYDDDPAGNPGDSHFQVAPNLGDTPLQTARKYIFIDNAASVGQLEVTMSSQPGAGGTTTIVLDELVPANNGITGTACTTYLGDPAVAGTVANGLVATGQKTSAEILNHINRCTQQSNSLYTLDIPISKHLPPGWYNQCVAISFTTGGSAAPFCTQIRVIAVTGFQTDVTSVDFGSLAQNIHTVVDGDFTYGSGGGTVMGLGNTSPILTVAYTWMTNTQPDGTKKYIKSKFDTQLNRRDSTGLITQFQLRQNMVGSDPALLPAFTGATQARLSEVCLEPNEPLKLDFSITPLDFLYNGTYSGLVRLTIDNTPGCVPTLGTGESSGGDADSIFNNVPSANTVNNAAAPIPPAP